MEISFLDWVTIITLLIIFIVMKMNKLNFTSEIYLLYTGVIVFGILYKTLNLYPSIDIIITFTRYLFILVLILTVLKSYLLQQVYNRELLYFIEKYKLDEIEEEIMYNKVCDIADRRNQFPEKDFIIAINFIEAIYKKDGEKILHIHTAKLISTDNIKISSQDIEGFKNKYLSMYHPKKHISEKKKILEEIANINSNYSNQEKRIAQEILKLGKELKTF